MFRTLQDQVCHGMANQATVMQYRAEFLMFKVGPKIPPLNPLKSLIVTNLTAPASSLMIKVGARLAADLLAGSGLERSSAAR